jgi:2'-5' RNA ligase
MEKLVNLKKIVLDKFKAENVNCAGNYYEFVPHLTIFKIKNNNTKASKSQQTNVEELTSGYIWKKYDEFYFGNEEVAELDLCKMGNIFELKTYPVEYTIKLN